MMIVSSLATLYFTKPGFRKTVHYFFSTSEAKLGNPPPAEDATPKEYVEEQALPVLKDNVKPRTDWKRWTKEDETR